MKIKQNKFKIVLILLLIVTSLFGLASCINKDKDKRQYVEIIVKHPITGEIIKDHGWMEFQYDENFVMPDVSLKLRDKDIYLTDKDFDNGSWKSHMMLLIDKDGTYMEQSSWEKDWPKEVGQYEIMITFNEDGWAGEKSKNDRKYFQSLIVFTLKITE